MLSTMPNTGTSTLNRLRPLPGSSKPMQCLAASAGLEFRINLPPWGLVEQWRRHFARVDSFLGWAGNGKGANEICGPL
jgi:hypothetical protein